MSSKRVKLGGAGLKKKQLKLEELKRKITKLQTFFTPLAVSTD